MRHPMRQGDGARTSALVSGFSLLRIPGFGHRQTRARIGAFSIDALQRIKLANLAGPCAPSFVEDDGTTPMGHLAPPASPDKVEVFLDPATQLRILGDEE